MPVPQMSPKDIPLPIVKLNRWVLLTGILGGALLDQPIVTTALFLILLPAVTLGKKASLIYLIGSKLFAGKINNTEFEDGRLQRFNNIIATSMLFAAQIAFLLGEPVIGWSLAFVVAIAAGIALAGFCVGCFLYYQFKQQRYRLFGK